MLCFKDYDINFITERLILNRRTLKQLSQTANERELLEGRGVDYSKILQ
jgi:hypothetical protein